MPCRFLHRRGTSTCTSGPPVTRSGDKFGNNFSGTGGGLATYVQSNAPVVDVGLSSVSNFVWHDLNSNGRQDAGEPGLAGVPVTLTGTDYAWDGDSYEVLHDYDAAPLVTTTNGSGNYIFSGLNHGTFQVRFPTTTAGLGLTELDTATDTTDSDADPATGNTAVFCLGEAPHVPGTGPCPDYTGLEANQTKWDAGYAGVGAIGDLVWADTNGDGQKQAGESGLSGWDVALIGVGTDGLIDTADDEQVGATVQTDTNGTYAFTGLAPGPYRVQITPENGWAATRRDSGNDSSDSDVDPSTQPNLPSSPCPEPRTTPTTLVTTSRPASATASGSTMTPTASRMAARPISPACASTSSTPTPTRSRTPSGSPCSPPPTRTVTTSSRTSGPAPTKLDSPSPSATRSLPSARRVARMVPVRPTTAIRTATASPP